MIIWCMLPQIWSATDIIFCYFRPFFALLPHYWHQKLKFGKKCKKRLEILPFYTRAPKIKVIWCMVPEISSMIWAVFCPFIPLTTWKIKILKKWKKNPGGIIILNMSTINENHMMYDSWDMEHNRQIFFSFWTIFCPFIPFPPLTTQRIKILKKWK